MPITIKTLSEVCEISSSKRIYASEYKKSGIPFYRGREIIERQKGKLRLSAELFISEEKYNEVTGKFGAPNAGDLLLTSVGTLGVPYVVKSSDKFYFKDGNLTWFKDFKGLDSGYLYYWLLSPSGKAELKKATIGSSQSAFTIVLLKRLEIELPDIETQMSIVGKLKAYDDLIENNSKRIEKLEAIARLLYAQSITNNPPQVNLSEITGMISRGISPKYDVSGESLVINQRCIREQKIDLVIARRQSKPVPSTKLIRSGDVLVNSTGVGTLGRVAQVYGEYTNVSVDSHVSIVRPGEDVNPYFFGAALMDKQADFESLGTGATGQTELGRNAIARVSILLPSRDIQDSIGSKIEPIRGLIHNLQLKNRKLTAARDLLLPRLMSGKMEI